jgi:hypothetical protein
MLSAQTAADLDTLLDASAVTNAQAAKFVLAASGLIAPAASEAAAFGEAKGKDWLPKKAETGDAITMGRASLLIMKALGIKGGLIYRLAPGPRRAYRAMVRRSLIREPADPNLVVTGEQFLLILGGALSYADGEL